MHFSGVATVVVSIVWLLLPMKHEYMPRYDICCLDVAKRWSRLRLVSFVFTKAFATGSPANVSIAGLSQLPLPPSIKWIVDHRSPNLYTLAAWV
ncbi:MAG: hypothetical protein U0930_24020 [Pirellulales bacterium]